MPDPTTLLIYGAYGYSGDLIVHEAISRGLRPIIAGRDSEAIAEMAKRLKLPSRVFGLDNEAEIDAGLDGVEAVLHCAGPFIHTALPMARACMRNGVHYLDITGEIPVFESLAALDAEAKESGIVLLPGVGFDVVPTDCLAAYLASRLPDADHLTLAFATSGGMSRGTAATMAENAGSPGAVRRDGRIVPVPPAFDSREIDFGEGMRLTATIPWGDVSTAWYSTGIPNIEVFAAMSPVALRSLRMSRLFGWLLSWGPVNRRLVRKARSGRAGPLEIDRARGRSQLWGEVRNPAGTTRRARLRGPEGYTLTARTAVESAIRVMAEEVPAGFQTPSRAFGAGYILEFAGVKRVDIP